MKKSISLLIGFSFIIILFSCKDKPPKDPAKKGLPNTELTQKKVTDILQNQLYVKNEKPGQYQFDAGEEGILRYWTVSDIIRLNVAVLNNPNFKFTYTTTDDKQAVETAYYISNGDTIAVDAETANLSTLIFEEMQTTLDLNCVALTEAVQSDCNCENNGNSYSLINNEGATCLIPPDGDQASVCSVNNIWGGRAICGIINDMPWKYSIKPMLKIGNKRIEGLPDLNDLFYKFGECNFSGYSGLGSVTSQLSIDGINVGNIVLPFVLDKKPNMISN